MSPSRPLVLLALALSLGAALALPACAPATAPAAPAAPVASVNTSQGAVLGYEVVAGDEAYPFTVVVVQNGAEGITFRYDLGDGAQTGTVAMSAGAVQSATGMLNQFGTRGYQLDDRTSVWLAREPFAAMRSGGTVALDLGDGPQAFAGRCTSTTEIGTAGGATYSVPSCTFRSDASTLITARDARQPLILDMTTGGFRVVLRSAAAQ